MQKKVYTLEKSLVIYISEASVDIVWLLFWEGFVLHFTTRTTHKTTRAAMQQRRAYHRMLGVANMSHTVAAKPHCNVLPAQSIGGDVLKGGTPDSARPALYMLNTTIQHTHRSNHDQAYQTAHRHNHIQYCRRA